MFTRQNTKAWLIDLSESKECIDAGKAALQDRLGSVAIEIKNGKSLLSGQGLQELLFSRRNHTMLVVPSRNRARIVPWFEAALSLSLSRENLFYEAVPKKLGSLARIPTLIRSAALILADSFWAVLYLGQAWLRLQELKRAPSGASVVRDRLKSEKWKIMFMRCDSYVGVKSGGSVGHLAGVINAMANNGHQVELYSSDYLEGVDYSRVNLHECQGAFRGWNIPIGGGSIFTDRAVTELAEQSFKRGSPDVIYHRLHLGTLGAPILKKKYNLPLILEFNGSEVWVGKNWSTHKKQRFEKLFSDLEMQALRFADAIVVVSQVLKEGLIQRGIPAEKILFVPNGVDPNKFDPERLVSERERIREELRWSGNQIIGFVGTFGKWHGTDVLVSAINEIANQSTKLRFLVIGDGQLRPAFESALSPDARKIVHMTGRIAQDKTPSYLAACDAFVSPHVSNPDGSRFFGSPTKLFEYMAMAKPIFASRLEQIGEIIQDGKSGVLLEPGNSEALRRALEVFQKSPEHLAGLGRSARERALSKFTWDVHWRQIAEFFRKRIS